MPELSPAVRRWPRSAAEPRLRRCFFFSSRRRHTRSLCDWSSDVCSSDLTETRRGKKPAKLKPVSLAGEAVLLWIKQFGEARVFLEERKILVIARVIAVFRARSEERRVGKECRSGWWPYMEKKREE